MRAEMWFFVAFISIFYAVGFGLLGYSVVCLKRSTEAAAWPTVPGKLTHCDLNCDHDTDGDTFAVQVRYEYAVAGRDLSNDVLAFGYSPSSGKSVHQEIFDRLSSASSVEVRYNPDDPGTSVLSYGVHRSIQFFLAFAITWLLFVIGFTILWWVSSQSDDVLLRNLGTH
ncbi:MAG: DUF3592 domain-containing protein [Planctomycetaceae bacterium]|nr:DUF3592 domain-containing protein [Planctomycetaceae bacterium]